MLWSWSLFQLPSSTTAEEELQCIIFSISIVRSSQKVLSYLTFSTKGILINLALLVYCTSKKKKVFKKIYVIFKYNDLWMFTKDLQIVSDLFLNKVLNNINTCTVLYSSRIRLISYIDWLAMQIESDTTFLASKTRNLFSLLHSEDLICWMILLTLTVPFSLI